jgi:hypothetical protein
MVGLRSSQYQDRSRRSLPRDGRAAIRESENPKTLPFRSKSPGGRHFPNEPS